MMAVGMELACKVGAVLGGIEDLALKAAPVLAQVVDGV